MENILIYKEDVYCVPLKEFERIRDFLTRSIDYFLKSEGGSKKFVKPCEIDDICEYFSNKDGRKCLYNCKNDEPGNLFDWKILTDENEVFDNSNRCEEEDNRILHRIYQGCFDNFLI